MTDEEDTTRGYLFSLFPDIDNDFGIHKGFTLDSFLEIPNLYLQGAEFLQAFCELYDEDDDSLADLGSLSVSIQGILMRKRMNPSLLGPFLVKTEFDMSREEVEEYINNLHKQGGNALKDFMGSAKF